MNITKEKKSIKETSYRATMNPVVEFRSFGKDVRNYMGMHWFGGVFLSYTTILPVFMYKMGINVLQAGILFSIAAMADVILTFILGRYFDRISPNIGMALDWFTESWPVFIFAFATTYVQFFIGILAQKATNILTPSYKVYENEIFPEENRSLIYTYHLFTPEIFSIVILPIVGYLLTYKFNTIFALRVTFIVCGMGFLVTSLIPKKVLKQVEPFKIEEEKKVWHFPKDLYLVAFAEIIIIICGQLTSVLITAYYVLDKMKGTLLDVILMESINSLVVVIIGLISRNFIERIPEFKLAQFGIIFFIIYTGFMSISNSIYFVLIAIVFRAIGDIIWFPSHSSILMRLVPKEKRGLFFGGLSSLSKLLIIVIPIISAFIAKTFGFLFIFVLASVLYIVAFFIYQRLLRGQVQNQ